MDAFLTQQLFTQDVMVLLRQPKEQANDGDTYKELQTLVTAHGGIVVDQENDDDARVTIVLLLGQTQDQDAITSRFPLAAILRAQWVKDSVQKNQRLDMTSYRVLELQDASCRTEPQTKKKQKIVTAGSKTVIDTKEALIRDVQARPHFRPWTTVLGSLHVLDARAQKQDGEQETDRRYKIAGFDLDWTLIVTKCGKKFAQNHTDWKWFHRTLVKDKLDKLARDGFTLTIFSNQNGVAKGHITVDQIQVWREQCNVAATVA